MKIFLSVGLNKGAPRTALQLGYSGTTGKSGYLNSLKIESREVNTVATLALT